MSLGDIFGDFPGRPEHPDMRKLTHVILIHDGKTEDASFDFAAHLAEVIDPETITHVAMQRSLRMLSHAGAPPAMQAMLASVWLDAFIMGVRWQQAQEKES